MAILVVVVLVLRYLWFYFNSSGSSGVVCVCGGSLEIPLWILCLYIKTVNKRNYSGVGTEEETSKQVLWREVLVLGYNCHASAEEEENDIFLKKNVKALVKKRTRLAISYSRLLFSPFLLARNATEQLYKSLTLSATTHPSFLSVLDPRLQKHHRTGKVTVCWKNSPHLFPHPIPLHNGFAYNPPTLSFFGFHPRRVTPLQPQDDVYTK